MDTPRTDRIGLRRALLATEPWLDDPDRGPQAVDAGPCDRCRERPRLLPTCGPHGWPGLCRTCALALGTDAWCDGHLDEAEADLAWARRLPAHWDVAVTLWWVATGEVRPGSVVELRDASGLAAEVQAALPAGDELSAPERPGSVRGSRTP